MSEPAGFVDEFRSLAGVDSRYQAERLLTATLSTVLRHLPAGLTLRVCRRLPRRLSGCLRYRETPGPAPTLDELLQEVAVHAGISDPLDTEAYLSATLVALAHALPVADLEALRAALPAAGLLLDGQDPTRCLLCAPLPWPVGPEPERPD